MKQLFLALLFCAGSTVALAQTSNQDDRQQADLDKIQQEQQLPAQLNMERNARITSQREHNEKIAKRKAKRKVKKLSKLLGNANANQRYTIETPVL